MVYSDQLKQGCLRTITRVDDVNTGHHRGWSWRIHALTPTISLYKPFRKHPNSLRVAFATLSDSLRGKSGRVGTMGCQVCTCADTKGLGGGVKISARL